METLPIFVIRVLQLLADRYGMSCSLEELTSLLTSVFNTPKPLLCNESESDKKENEDRVLDVLIFLSNEGHIFLNSETGESCINIKGLILVNNKVLCN